MTNTLAIAKINNLLAKKVFITLGPGQLCLKSKPKMIDLKIIGGLLTSITFSLFYHSPIFVSKARGPPLQRRPIRGCTQLSFSLVSDIRQGWM
jgi:hypothetical protein